MKLTSFILFVLIERTVYRLPMFRAQSFCSPTSTLVTVQTKLSGVTQFLLLPQMFISCWICTKLTAKFIPINWMPSILTVGFSKTQTLRHFNRLRCICTDRRTIWWVLARMHQIGTGEIYRDLDGGWCRSQLRLTVRTLRLKLLTRPFRLGQLLYLLTAVNLIF